MKPIEIRIELLKRGYTNVRVAKEVGVSRSTLNSVLHGRASSRRVANRISKIVGIPVSRLWPGRYERALTRKAA